MNSKLISITLAMLGLLVIVMFLSGCNTWEGAGKDVERAGEKMQGD